MKRAPQPLRSSREAAKRAATGPVVSKDSVVAPSQAIVVRIATEVGANVAEGDVLAVLESMKMESYVLAPRAGRIEAINVEVGANVAPGHVLVTLSPEAESNEGGQK